MVVSDPLAIRRPGRSNIVKIRCQWDARATLDIIDPDLRRPGINGDRNPLAVGGEPRKTEASAIIR
jgi:hypothetical protein